MRRIGRFAPREDCDRAVGLDERASEVGEKIAGLEVQHVVGPESRFDRATGTRLRDGPTGHHRRRGSHANVGTRSRADHRQRRPQMDRMGRVEVRVGVVGDGDRLRPTERDVSGYERASVVGIGFARVKQRGVVREHVHVVEWIELIRDDGKVGRDSVGMARERGVGSRVELTRGAPIDLTRSELEDLEVVRRDHGRRDFVRLSGGAWRRVVLENVDRHRDVRFGVRDDDRELLRGCVARRVDHGVVEVDCPILATDVALELHRLTAQVDARSGLTGEGLRGVALRDDVVRRAVVAALDDFLSVARKGGRYARRALKEARSANQLARHAVVDGDPRRARGRALAAFDGASAAPIADLANRCQRLG